MSQFKHTIAILFAIGFAFLWLKTPSLSYYSLQAFALATFGFFISKRFSKAQIWHILPESYSFEIIFISFAVTILIGSTGNLDSVFYPFAYIHLFFLVMTTRQSTAVVASLAIMLTHYALEPTISTTVVASLTTLPIILVFFLFARRQYDDVRIQQQIAVEEKRQIDLLSQTELSLENFISEFMQPKLIFLKDLFETAIHRNELVDSEILNTQITLLESESQKILGKIQDDKSQFASETSYELRDPLALNKWYLEAIRDDDYLKNAPMKVQEYLNEVYSSNERLLKIVQKLVDVPKQGSINNQLRQTDIITLLENQMKESEK